MAQPVINQAINVKVKEVRILDVFIDVETVPFNRGFYSVDVTFFFKVRVNAYRLGECHPTVCDGIATFSKKVILFGSEGNVKVFTSDGQRNCHPSQPKGNTPKATLQVAEPICLACKLVECCDHHDECCLALPEPICCCFEGDFNCACATKKVLITLGLFTIVQLERSVQMMIPAYDYCIPDKESISTSDDPCEMFKRIKFPTNEFFPPKLTEMDCDE